jgi:polar amino acid transport system substrate-binding protein
MARSFLFGRGRTARLSALAFTPLLFLTACGDDGDDNVLQVGVNAEYPPGEFLDEDGETVVGFNVDLFDAVAEELGMETEWVPAEFDAIITGVDSGQYDVGVSSFTINEERLEQVHMISYMIAGTQWFTQDGNPDSIDPEDACGLNIAVEQATVQVEDLEARNEECVEAGEDEISLEQFDSQELATASVQSGVNHASVADSPVAGFAVEETGDELELLGEVYDDAPYGAVVSHENTELAEEIQAAYQAIMDDGTYESILEEWGVADGGIDTAALDPDVSE